MKYKKALKPHMRIARGGSCLYGWQLCRASYGSNDFYLSSDYEEDLGFRLKLNHEKKQL